jgi:Ca2+-binding RTX toxin-like protein
MASPFDTGIVESFDFTTGDLRIDPFLVLEYKWGNGGGEGTPATVTYSFPPVGAHWDLSAYSRPYADNEPLTFTPFDANQQAAARAALTLWSEVANISFVEIDESANLDNVGDIRFGNSGAVTNSDSAAWAWTPYDGLPYATYPENGDIWFDYEYDPNLELEPGEFGFSTMIHEIGHAIGLDHPFADEVGEIALPAGQANQRYSIMAYNVYSGATPGFEAYGPMLYDILALQYMYGANMTTRTGNDVYTFLTDKEYLECIWDAGGHDTIDLSLQSRNQVIDLRAGTFSSIGVKNNGLTGNGNVAIAFNVTIEDAIGGSGHDKITGNDVVNDLDGKAGNDTIVGGLGNDTLTGGTGNDSMSGGKNDDLYFVDSTLDKVIELANEGADTVKSTVSYSFALAPNVEHLELTGAGNLNGTGNASHNTILGNGGNNILDGGLGNDTLTGGAGNDTYILNAAGDVVVELGSDTGDTVKSSAASLAAFAGIENYFFTGATAFTFTGDGVNNIVSGGNGNDTLDGAGGDDTLLGNGGNDVLDGEAGDDFLDGGAGNDKMSGGSGNDIYVISAAGDVITEEGGDTEDQVKSSVTVNLAILASGLIEHAILTGATAINATGNDEDNELTGNSAANKLNGGAGADTLTGGNGADIYTVDDLGDVVQETTGGAAGGVDIVNSSIDFTLGANVEKLTLLASFGDIDGTGNSLNNTILGNEGGNRLDGDVGNDTMTGGAGGDTYVVDSTKDVVNETIANSKGGGIDTVESLVTFSLATRVNIDNLTLLGSGDINGTGNALANTILGNSGKNILDGGTGADILKGGAGNDVYVINTLADIVDEEGNTDTGDEVRTSAILPNAIVGIEIYTNTGSKAWDFLGSSDDDTVKGGTGKDRLTGSSGNDVLFGNAGDDGLAGSHGDDTLNGGAGKDFMNGGEGNDTYIVDSPWDFFFEPVNEGTDDRIISSVSYSLGLPMGIEHITLVGAAVQATGNDLDNALTGNTLANKLDGGVGADTMTGGAGNDTYSVDDVDDKVVEDGSAGIDTVQSSIDFSLATLVNIEKLTLAMGAGNIDGTGNGLNNTLLGNEGANILDGGAGNDTMTGGKGGDTYIVDSSKDVVNETVLNSAGGGIDMVESAVTFSLATRTNIENLTLTANAQINGIGNALNNHIAGSDGANSLDGGAGNDLLEGGLEDDTLIGGTGNDLLIGGKGADNLSGGSGVDTFDYNDFDEAGDTIVGFVKGAGGDILNLADLLADIGGVVGNAFSGFLDFQASGSDTLLLVDQDGGGNSFTTYLTLSNVSLTETDTANFILATA